MKGIVTALAGVLLLLGLGGQVVAPVTAAAQEEAVAKTNLKVGDIAPDFSLLSDKWEASEAERLSRQEKCDSRLLRPGIYRRLNERTSGLSG